MTRLIENLKSRADNLGFDALGITVASLSRRTGDNLEIFVDQGHHGTMSWMAETLARRKTPRAMWPQAKSAIVLATNYAPHENPLSRLEQKNRGVISVYALNRDYHDVVKGKLKQLAGWFAARTQSQVKVFVDTAPLMEKPLAANAGIGWQGKHTNLVSTKFGSWLFLGIILTDHELEAAPVHEDRCGSCCACLDICPTNAFSQARQIDARRCISYLTIEYDGHIETEFRKPMGNRIYGCDDCLAVCPWNKFAKQGRDAKLQAKPHFVDPPLQVLARLDGPSFRRLFSGSPVKRIGRNRFVRNVLIAIANSGDKALAETAIELVGDDSALVRAMAVWACANLLSRVEFLKIKRTCLPGEKDTHVIREWERLQ